MGKEKTFGELSESILVFALRTASDSNRIDVVFDVYRHSSIKNAERVHRGSESGLRFTNIVRGHKIKQWRRLLSSSESKVNFIRFLANDWQRAEIRAKLQGKVLYVTCDDSCYKIVEESAVEVEYLSCNHEEADTRVFVHARHAEEASSATILASEDTDVFVISLPLVHTFSCPTFMKSGTRNRERYVHVQKVASAVGHGTCCALPGMHSFTGCDSVSAFSGKGKVSAFKLLQKNKKYQEAFT